MVIGGGGGARGRGDRGVSWVIETLNDPPSLPPARLRPFPVSSAGLFCFCDVFVEETAFSPAEGRRILEAGAAHGLIPKIHADQNTDTGGGALAAAVGASLVVAKVAAPRTA